MSQNLQNTRFADLIDSEGRIMSFYSAEIEFAQEDDKTGRVKARIGPLDVANANGIVVETGVTGGENHKVRISKYNHSLRPTLFGGNDGQLPVGVGELYEVKHYKKTYLEVEALYNLKSDDGLEAYNYVKFAYDNNSPDDWSYGMQVGYDDYTYDEENDVIVVHSAQFFEASPVFIGAHGDSLTLKASKEKKMAETVVVEASDLKDIKGTLEQNIKLQTEAATKSADEFARLEKVNTELREKVTKVEGEFASFKEKVESSPFGFAGGDATPVTIQEQFAAKLAASDFVPNASGQAKLYTLDSSFDLFGGGSAEHWAAPITKAPGSGIPGMPYRNPNVAGSQGRVALIDMIPVTETTADVVTFYRENAEGAGATQGKQAATVADGSPAPDLNLRYPEVSLTIERVAGLQAVTDATLDDQARMASLLDRRVTAKVRNAAERLLHQGAVDAPGMRGANTLVGKIEQASAHNNDLDLKVQTLLGHIGSVAGRIEDGTEEGLVDILSVRSTWFWNIATAKDKDGRPLFMEFLNGGGRPLTVFGMSVARSSGQEAQKVTLVNSFYAELAMRKELSVEVGYNTDDFGAFRQSIRGSIRAAMQWIDPQAVGVITIATS